MIERAISIVVDRASERALTRLERAYPRHYWRAFAWAVSGALKQLKAGVRKGGGRYGIDAFAPKTAFTRDVERLEGRDRGWYGRIGKGKAITRWREGQAQHIGWVSGVASWAARVEERDQHEMSPAAQRYFRARGVASTPTWYNRSARDVITPFAAFQRAGEFAKNVNGSVRRLMEKEAAKR